jgi:hypothetical protein
MARERKPTAEDDSQTYVNKDQPEKNLNNRNMDVKDDIDNDS